jgi:SHC-transforming protein 1
MPNISFASGGDSESTNYVAYVAKDIAGWRACYVVDCVDKAQTVISTMGQAFELRYKNFCGDEKPRKSKSPTAGAEYYNDLPNKVPPEFSSESSGSERRRERLHSNLIDLNVSLEQKCDYVNESDAGSSRDVFDMQCFSLSPEVQLSQLLQENWFHGPISRGVAESLLRHDGDFLVRESQGSSQQYVLTGLNAGQAKHLLLIDPEGVVRTKDRVFENITHLINYHLSTRCPIISSDSALLLQTPVTRMATLTRR